ncbi:putative sulfoacetate transporter SauU [Gemmata obscuriglobus]|nr:MFS transporter [Gemmata obscuriglobus]QEG32180.1 putative sulfoacetate transporter SauU [Gemmata obscuriglobus]VTS11533.1 mfs transporter : Major facilitator superfamily MFS_1 OS=Chthoniobacter flavus Ellin428 GN=CfE428DRAFT_1073 PE=4 SV=1: MFS_1 [Gemmata obscuriglobus UQM 2246]
MPQRYLIVAVTAVAAFWMYIDRVCFSTLAAPMERELLLPLAPEPTDADTLSNDDIAAAKKKKFGPNPPAGAELSPEDVVAAKKKKWADKRLADILGAFFLTYALFQIPMGSLADRYGARAVLTVSIAAWSVVTMLTGFVGGAVALVGIRLLLGVTESGAYPAAAGLVKRWARPEERGRFSSVVAFGGRIGGVVAPWLTAVLAAALAGVALVEWAITPSPAALDANEAPVNWRGVFVVYGLCGVVVALLFWLIVRDNPPGAPAPAREGGNDPAKLSLVTRFAALARSRNMWLFGAMQFGMNLGWAFLVTLLPKYLEKVHDTPLDQAGRMQTVALGIGCLGMIFGGVFTDFTRRWLGPKAGRAVPIGAALSGCAVAFLLIPHLPDAWTVVIALGVMAFLVDMHNPTIWSFAQDVGGKNVGAALGWGNMWGNLGAAFSARVLVELQHATSWNTAFTCLAGAFAASAVCGFLLDATKPVEEPAA